MGKSTSRTHVPADGADLPPPARVSDEELLRRLDEPWRDDLLDDLGDRDEVMRRLFDLALQRLRRTNTTASRMIRESAEFRRDFDAWLARQKKSQAETRAMIEDLVYDR